MHHRSSRVGFVAALTLLAGCATMYQPETFDPLPFDEAEYAALPREGTGVVKGQVFAKTRGGDVKIGAGNNVILMPATAYGTQRYQEQVIGGKLASKAEDPRYIEYVRTTTADGDGRFTFSEVPPGRYYAVSTITWEVPSTNPYLLSDTQGGSVHKVVEVQNDQTVEVMLTR